MTSLHQNGSNPGSPLLRHLDLFPLHLLSPHCPDVRQPPLDHHVLHSLHRLVQHRLRHRPLDQLRLGTRRPERDLARHPLLLRLLHQRTNVDGLLKRGLPHDRLPLQRLPVTLLLDALLPLHRRQVLDVLRLHHLHRLRCLLLREWLRRTASFLQVRDVLPQRRYLCVLVSLDHFEFKLQLKRQLIVCQFILNMSKKQPTKIETKVDPQQDQKAKRVESPKKEKISAVEKKQTLNHLQKQLDRDKERIQLNQAQISVLKSHIQENDEEAVKAIKSRLNPVDLEVANREANKIDKKVMQSLMSGRIQFQPTQSLKITDDRLQQKQLLTVEKEKEQLRRQLKDIDFELGNLKNQKIDNPFSVYSQPTLKVYMQEDSIKRQQNAFDFVTQINQKEQSYKMEYQTKLKQQEEKKKQKLMEEENMRKKHEMEVHKKKQEDLKQHIKQLKVKHEHRLKEMIDFEEKYFTNLESKLKSFNESRKHLKGSQKSQMPIRNHYKKLVEKYKGKVKELKEVKVEKPLFMRVREEYREQLKKEKEEFEKTKEDVRVKHTSHIDVEKRVAELGALRKQKEKELEKKRMEKLAKLGLKNGISQRLNVSYDSQLWLMQQEDKPDLRKVQVEMSKEKRVKMLSYADQVREKKPIRIDEDQKLKALIARDQLVNPQKYIEPIKKKEKVEKVDKADLERLRFERQKEILQQEFAKLPEEERLLEMRSQGKLYLKQIPENVKKYQEELAQKKARDDEQARTLKKRPLAVSQSAEITKKAALPPQKVDYLAQFKSQYNLDALHQDQYDWKKVLDRPVKLPKIKPEKMAKTADEKDTFATYAEKIHYDKLRAKQKRVDHLNHVQDKAKQEHQQKHATTKEDEIYEIANRLDQKAHKMEKIAKSQWTTKPLKALDQENQLDDIYIDSIKAKLQVLKMRQGEEAVVEKEPQQDDGQDGDGQS